MTKTLGDYNKERSSSANLKNIKWSKKSTQDSDKPKKRNKKKIPPTNTVIKQNKPIEDSAEKIFKIKNKLEENKPKRKIIDKKIQKASVTNSKVEQGFHRPGR